MEISNQIRKNMYGIKSIGGNFESNKKKYVWNKRILKKNQIKNMLWLFDKREYTWTQSW